MKSPPSYSWSCHGCAANNTAGSSTCAQCGLSAFATAAQIEQSRKARVPDVVPDQTARPESDWLVSGAWSALFFPEVIPAALVLIASPIWLLSLLVAGNILAAVVLATGIATAIAIGYFARRAQSRGLIYTAMIVVLFAALETHSLSSGRV